MEIRTGGAPDGVHSSAMPAMFIERARAITEDEWRQAVVVAGGARLAPGTLDVELRDDAGGWRRVITWVGGRGELSMQRFHAPYVAQLQAIAVALGARIIDDDGALYFEG